jgi:hypothetical protein
MAETSRDTDRDEAIERLLSSLDLPARWPGDGINLLDHPG